MKIPDSPKDLIISECRFSDIRHIFEEFHYKKAHMGGGISWCLSASYDGQILAGMVIGKARHDKKYSAVLKTVELRRMACVDDLPCNSESWFLGKSLKWLRDNTDIERVISYSDKSVGHKGTIYKASNFTLIGETAPSKHIFWNGRRYHPRSMTVDRPYSYKMREGVKTGETKIEIGEPKLIFEYMIRRKKYKRA